MRQTHNRVSQHIRDVERLRASLPGALPPVARPVLVVMSGLPGSGKSYFSRRLVAKAPLLVLESDRMRKVLVQEPSYSTTESARLFRACHALISDLMREGISILLDATNLIEGNRERLYYIAERLGASLILVHLKAPPEIVYERLKGRSERAAPGDHSSAGWGVYQKMYSTFEPIKRNHFEVDTSKDISEAINEVAREIRRYMGTPDRYSFAVAQRPQ